MNRILRLMLLSVFILNVSCNMRERLYLNFGEAKKELESRNDQTIKIFFDRKGYIYPDYPINDSYLRTSDSRLEEYFTKDTVTYNAICKQYNVKPHLAGEFDVNDNPLQEAIILQKAALLNSQNKELFFIIHGFNDHPQKPNDDSSYVGMTKTREWIESHYPNRFVFVEIYWDGLSRKNGNKALFYNAPSIWAPAQENASNTGFELRRLFSKLNKPKNYVLTHSLGASVIVTALFNVIKIDDPKQVAELEGLFKDATYNTPSSEFHVGMLAPAIPGENTFMEYHDRTVDGKEVTIMDSNYFFTVGFNSFDIVTNKGAFAKNFGSTTLSCNRRELERTRRLFEHEAFIMDYEDFSYCDKDSKQRSHSWLKYIENDYHFKNFIAKLLK